jgi:Opioid growth factor receptor (OGFr) conserved region
VSEGRRIVAFFEGAAPDDRGRFFDDILRFDDDALETTHDFIQWLFPLRERSGANPGAPRLDDAAVAAFTSRPELRQTQRRALARMLSFYGLRWNGDHIEPSAAFAELSQWLTPGNHNHLRLTRMLASLRALGSERESRALLECLLAIAAAQRHAISETTLQYWRDAGGS